MTKFNRQPSRAEIVRALRETEIVWRLPAKENTDALGARHTADVANGIEQRRTTSTGTKLGTA